MESRRRSLVKAASWQLSGLATMTALGFAFTGSVTAGGTLAMASAGVGFACYLIHERVWASISWGRTHRPH